MSKKMKIMWLGLRGFPDVQGGVENHAQHLCYELALLGCDVTVLTRSKYQVGVLTSCWQDGIRMRKIWAPRTPGLEALVHTFFGVIYASIKRPDILHIQAIGPAIWTPFARALGLKVVVTHHGQDYERQKWGALAKMVLRMGEKMGVNFSNKNIVISSIIQNHIKKKYNAQSTIIANGVPTQKYIHSFDILHQFNLVPKKYVLMVSRFVPEKRHNDLIDAFRLSALSGWKLVIVGDVASAGAYTKSILEKVATMDDIICVGFRSGIELAELYSNAGFFVLPSSYEGLPIAILEAMSYGLVAIASDIPANREVACGAIEYFPVGDVNALSAIMLKYANHEFEEWRREHGRRWVRINHSWPTLAQKTYKVYADLLQTENRVA